MTTNIDIASRALARLGEPSISSFTEDSDTAEKVALLYETTILGLLSSYNWRFATVKSVLSEDGAAAPINKWTRGFIMPDLNTDRVGPPLKVYASESVGVPVTFDYEVQDRWIMTNHTTIVMEYVQRKSESLWPGYFTKLAIEAVAASLALPVTENASKEQHHLQVAFGSPSDGGRGGLFKLACEADASGNPTRGLLDDHDPIWNVRFGGGGW